MNSKDRRTAFEDGVLAGFAFASNIALDGLECSATLEAVVGVLQAFALNPGSAPIVADYAEDLRKMYTHNLSVNPEFEADRVQDTVHKLMALIRPNPNAIHPKDLS